MRKLTEPEGVEDIVELTAAATRLATGVAMLRIAFKKKNDADIAKRLDQLEKDVTNLFAKLAPFIAADQPKKAEMDKRERTELEQMIQRLLRQKKDRFEARAWLEDGGEKSVRFIGEMSKEQSIKFVQKLYRLGAKEVMAVKIGRNPPYESINTMIVTLPSDRKARQQLFAFEGKRVESEGFDPPEDYGQSHLLVWIG